MSAGGGMSSSSGVSESVSQRVASELRNSTGTGDKSFSFAGRDSSAGQPDSNNLPIYIGLALGTLAVFILYKKGK